MALSKEDILEAVSEMSVMDVVELVEAMEHPARPRACTTQAQATTFHPAIRNGVAKGSANFEPLWNGNLKVFRRLAETMDDHQGFP